MERFNQAALNIIKKLSHPFFMVRQDFEVRCVCTQDASKQADPACRRCLGTGFKIKISNVEGASQDSDVPSTLREGMSLVVAKNFYIPVEFGIIKNDNLIVDGDEVFFVYQKLEARSFGGELVYHKCMSIAKKSDTKIFLENFNRIVGRENT